MEIQFFNHHTKKVETEKVYGDQLIEWLYKSTSGQMLSHFLCKAPLSKLYGAFQNTSLSASKIESFVKNYQINLDEFQPEDGRDAYSPYSNFNQFFIRRFKKEKRPFSSVSSEFGAFAEARYFGYSSISDDETYPVKGHYLSAAELLANSKWNQTFAEGPLLLARLCPVDYHRFHYPDDGVILDEFRVPGLFHSVNPLALKAKQDIFITNERHVTIVETEHFGKLAYIEVGAICVGKIVQTNPLAKGVKFKKGDEKGYFLFGGSTVIVIGEKGKWIPHLEILENTKKGMETYFHLGTTVASIG
jgi:phosphatidylserine decarboxylase